ncbi:MAG: helix-turn-helix domain-containing protein [Gammaproteobacteria bacterium]|nr:helix-turn-helix domain-containing protein [Gammaproteobacteria bacterium]
MNTGVTKGHKEAGPTVRSLVRGLTVLRLLNVRSGLSNAQVAANTNLNRITTYRLLQTLMREGYVVRDSVKRYRLAPGVLELNSRYTRENWIFEAAAPMMQELCREVGWPIVLATNNGPYMTIQHTTRDETGFWLRFQGPGSKLPILNSAVGFAFLAHTRQRLQDDLIKAALQLEDGVTNELHNGPSNVHALLKKVRRLGYATLRKSWESEGVPLSAIAVPLVGPQGILGSLGLTYYRATLTNSEAIKRYVAPLQSVAERIGQAV